MEVKKFSKLNRFTELVHGMSTRMGGVSREPFNSLNMGLSTSDDPDAVETNRRQFFDYLGVSPKRVVFPEQVHSDHVEIVLQPGTVERTDALITNQKNLFITVQTADCFPVFVYDPMFGVAGLVHSGWRGTSRNIVGKTIRKMQNVFGSSPGRLTAAVGSGIQGVCYQVDSQTAAHFNTKYCTPDVPGHLKLDVLAAILDQLRGAGIPPEQIEWDDTCTHCRKDLYYSYRRDGSASGRMMAILGIK